MSIVTVERNVGRERGCSKAPRSVGWAGTKTNRKSRRRSKEAA